MYGGGIRAQCQAFEMSMNTLILVSKDLGFRYRGKCALRYSLRHDPSLRCMSPIPVTYDLEECACKDLTFLSTRERERERERSMLGKLH